MGYVKEHKVYGYASIDECRRVTGKGPIDTRWIDTNKGDEKSPNYRSRWVAKDFRRAWVETIFSATPSIETLRLLLADAANRCQVGGNPEDDICILIVDIKRAYFYAKAQKDVYIKLPPEDPRAGDPNACGKLLKSLYGTRDAGANWHREYTGFLQGIGMKQGVTNPCHFTLLDRCLRGLVHG